MDLWKMRYFIRVCHDKSITKAACNLYISQQGLSKTIKSIEDEFQLPLLERSSRGVKPTKYGEVLLNKSIQIINEYDSMVKFMNQELLSNNSLICIGIASILHTDSLKSILFSFQEKNPDVTFKFIELGYYACEEYLKENLVDFCITLKPDTINDYKYIPLCKTNLVLLLNKNNSLSKKKSLIMSDLKNQNFIMLTEDYKLGEIINCYCLSSGFKPKSSITTSQLEFIKELVELNMGIAILPDINYIKMNEDTSNIVIAPVKDLSCQIELGIIINKSKKLTKLDSNLLKLVDTFKFDFNFN